MHNVWRRAAANKAASGGQTEAFLIVVDRHCFYLRNVPRRISNEGPHWLTVCWPSVSVVDHVWMWNFLL